MTTNEVREMVRPIIVENYEGFEPPSHFRDILEKLLNSVSPEYLLGLKTIILTNQSALTRDQRQQKTVAEDWSKRLFLRFLRAHYWYLMPLLYPLALYRWLRRLFHGKGKRSRVVV